MSEHAEKITAGVYSLRWLLLRMIAIPLMVGSLLVVIFSATSIYLEIAEVYDANLAQYAKILMQVVDTDKVGKKDDVQKGQNLSSDEGNIAYRTYQKGEMFNISKRAKGFGNVSPPTGFSNQVIKGKLWRFFVLLSDDGDTRVEVGQKFALRHEMAFQLMGSLWLPGLLFLVVVFVTTWSGVTRGMKQVTDLSAQVDSRDASDLTPITPERMPEEITPFMRALNRLLGRMNESLLREREFTDNAAHELRTPLAAIKAQAQAIEGSQPKGKTLEGMDNLLQSIDRSTYMVEQLLAFSRLQGAGGDRAPVELAPVIEDVLTELSPVMSSRSIVPDVSLAADCVVQGNDHALFLLFKNIIDNAVKFSPGGGDVHVRLFKADERIVFEVQDAGPGVPPEYLSQIFDRFFRMNKSTTPGSGIGLAIVKWVAQAHGAQIEAVNTHPGLCFRLAFPSI
jgi:signal transduction histidine kinase